MKTIELQAELTDDHVLTLYLPESVEAGNEVRVRLTSRVATGISERRPLDLPIHHVGPWPENLSLRREDMYDDDGSSLRCWSTAFPIS